MAATTSFRFQDGRMHQPAKDQPPQQIYPSQQIIKQAADMFSGMQTPSMCTAAIASMPMQLQHIALAPGHDQHAAFASLGQPAIPNGDAAWCFQNGRHK